MPDPDTHLLLRRAFHRELVLRAAQDGRAARLVRLRRLDRRAERLAARARLVRHCSG